ncbi:MAG: hypothetical protein GY878_27195 [Fuerstiella sp.]|nr:hypothetical protein [Fuerstiella sp.]
MQFILMTVLVTATQQAINPLDFLKLNLTATKPALTSLSAPVNKYLLSSQFVRQNLEVFGMLSDLLLLTANTVRRIALSVVVRHDSGEDAESPWSFVNPVPRENEHEHVQSDSSTAA